MVQVMELGRLNQKASVFLTGFVFGCIFMVILLLYIAQKAVERAEALSYATGDYSHYLK